MHHLTPHTIRKRVPTHTPRAALSVNEVCYYRRRGGEKKIPKPKTKHYRRNVVSETKLQLCQASKNRKLTFVRSKVEATAKRKKRENFLSARRGHERYVLLDEARDSPLTSNLSLCMKWCPCGARVPMAVFLMLLFPDVPAKEPPHGRGIGATIFVAIGLTFVACPRVIGGTTSKGLSNDFTKSLLTVHREGRT